MPMERGSELGWPCVLVVEDEALIRAVIADELRSAGFQVVEASNADEALKYIATGERVDAVFSDIQMPGSINGAQLAEVLKRELPALPVILTSGYVGCATISDPERFIPKPYRPELVAQEIARLVESRDDRADSVAC